MNQYKCCNVDVNVDVFILYVFCFCFVFFIADIFSCRIKNAVRCLYPHRKAAKLYKMGLFLLPQIL